MNWKHSILNLKIPFFALAIAFILIGVVLGDHLQIKFGFVWIFIGLIELYLRNLRRQPDDKS